MKAAADTNQDEILDEAWLHQGGESLGWSVFGRARLNPAELLEEIEERAGDELAVRMVVFPIMLDMVLDGWARECDVLAVGRRCLALGSALGHALASGSPMLGARARLGGAAGADVALRVLDHWLWGEVEVAELGKRVLAIALYFNHEELNGWSLTQLARACDESATWMSKRVRKTCNKPIEASGGRGEATWQQGPEQRKRSAEVQTGTRRNKSKNEEK